MTAYTLDTIQADVTNDEGVAFPAGIPVDILDTNVRVENGVDRYYTRILIRENNKQYTMLVPWWVILEFDSPIDMAGI